MNVCGEACLSVSGKLFDILVTVLSLAVSDDIINDAQGTFLGSVLFKNS